MVPCRYFRQQLYTLIEMSIEDIEQILAKAYDRNVNTSLEEPLVPFFEEFLRQKLNGRPY